jgi:hypothetical protein
MNQNDLDTLGNSGRLCLTLDSIGHKRLRVESPIDVFSTQRQEVVEAMALGIPTIVLPTVVDCESI